MFNVSVLPVIMQHLGEVKVADDSDFSRLKTLCQVHDEWKQVYNKNGVLVWTKTNDVSDFNMVKIHGSYSDITADSLYDVLHDPQYRKAWDPQIIEGYDICRINPNSDIGYYAMKLVKPLMNRDFVTQRSWLDLGSEKMIFNHSVNHAKVPPKKSFIRGISYLTGYYVVSLKGDPSEPGCQLTYVTQSDPKGKLPVWAVNMATSMVAPKVMSRLHKASRGYAAWKAQHKPDYKPWRFPEQSSLVQFDPADLGTMNDTENAELIDETSATEENGSDTGDELAKADEK